MRIAVISLLAMTGLCLSQYGNGAEFVPPPASDEVHREIIEEKLCMEKSVPGWGGCFRSSNIEVPEKAKFALDNDLIAKANLTLNNTMYQSEKAYRALIEAGDYARLHDYWNMIYKEVGFNQMGANNPTWFKLDFALAQTQKAATLPIDPGISASLQLELARYFIHGCPQNKLQGTRNVSGNNEPPSLLTLIDKLGKKCQPQPAQAVRWFTAYASNPAAPPSDVQLHSSEIADWYFYRNQYPEALGWYLATLKIAETDPAKFNRDEAAQFAVNYLLASRPVGSDEFHAILQKSVAEARGEYATRAEAAKRRIALLQDLRVQAVSSYELNH
jgi:hypothetical protein